MKLELPVEELDPSWRWGNPWFAVCTRSLSMLVRELNGQGAFDIKKPVRKRRVDTKLRFPMEDCPGSRWRWSLWLVRALV